MLEDLLKQYATDNGIDLAATPATDDAAQQSPKRKIKQRLKYHLDRRRGKLATIITGFQGSDEELQGLASRLKQKLAVGGSARDGEILLQGDVIDKVKKIVADQNL